MYYWVSTRCKTRQDVEASLWWLDFPDLPHNAPPRSSLASSHFQHQPHLSKHLYLCLISPLAPYFLYALSSLNNRPNGAPIIYSSKQISTRLIPHQPNQPPTVKAQSAAQAVDITATDGAAERLRTSQAATTSYGPTPRGSHPPRTPLPRQVSPYPPILTTGGKY